ncbi:DNA primase [Bacillus licheniformis]|uniref:toprim domain-containing protein n=1 Tax=Bacillus licheniformis TaxID=1402 RepID=UPI0011A1B94F|nr:toprim domain-containing protein [Bacillus licheniformis]TWM32260.1 DNA primase [Bacillus licheniformis]
MLTIKRDGRDYELNVDVLEELNYYEWNRARVKPNEMVACSPFRNERSPSFSINLETGLWIDFGSDEEFSRGNLITLLAYLRNETPQEVENYLLDKYGIDLSDISSLELGIDLTFEENHYPTISIEEYRKYAFRSPYLAQRGISEKVQKAFKIGFDKQASAVAFPWIDIHGNIVNIKFRSTKSKYFFYHPAGQQIKNHIYGMYFIYKKRCETAYLVESEIDALYLWSNGFPAIALGGSNVSGHQRQLILRSPVKRLVFATDNDLVGKDIRTRLTDFLIGYKDLHEIVLPSGVKDVNDLPPEQLRKVCDNTRQVEVTLFQS